MRATAVVIALLSVSCARLIPWRDDPRRPEVNLAFTMDRNLIRLDTLTIDNRSGVFILGTAAPATVVDDGFALSGGRRHAVQIGEKETVRIAPARIDLSGVADAIVGADVWRNQILSIDYRSGLATYLKYSVDTADMKGFRYDAEPMIYVNVDGRDVAAVVDTTIPDTLILPGADGRGAVNVRIGETDFGAVDVRYAGVTTARIGNRLLSRFLVTIDYGRNTVSLWRDRRMPL